MTKVIFCKKNGVIYLKKKKGGGCSKTLGKYKEAWFKVQGAEGEGKKVFVKHSSMACDLDPRENKMLGGARTCPPLICSTSFLSRVLM